MPSQAWSQDVELQMQRVALEHVQLSVPNYLSWSVLNVIFCCFPFGLVALNYSRRVSRKMAQRDVEGAKNASDWALACNVLSLIAGIACWIYFVTTYGNQLNEFKKKVL